MVNRISGERVHRPGHEGLHVGHDDLPLGRAHPHVTIDDLPVGVLELEDGALVAANAHWTALTGFDARASRGSGWIDAVHPDDRVFAVGELSRPPRDGSDLVGDIRLLRTARRGELWVQAHARRLPTPGPARHVVTLTEVSSRKSTERRLAHLASHDSLTGSLTRAAFMQEVDGALGRTGCGSTAAVLFIDLDHFKSVNDTLGHEAGDLILVAACGRVHGALRSSDRVGRIGGDEIGVLCQHLRSLDEAIVVADRIISALHEPFPVDDRSVRIGASVGIAMADDAPTDAEELLRRADEAMYRAKAGGRGRWELAQPTGLATPLTLIDLDRPSPTDAATDQPGWQRSDRG